ncbi:MAG TPA: methyltransferase domain-containing protein [Candidatus Dormibacteraeota bacterium]|nr:methyltransferase domain-containing protein [Candidatus Dormibacteraeota bacterium]
MDRRAAVRQEFSRTAEAFTRRTRDRYRGLGVVEFARSRPGERVLEVGAGSAGFLKHFTEAGLAVALDLTPAMLELGRREHPWIACVVGDGGQLPFATARFDLVASALAFHHLPDPLPVLREMARVSRGRVLVVDQCAAEDPDQAATQTRLERLRDPTHAVSRPASAYRDLLGAAGVAVLDERLVEHRARLDRWITPEEFPAERIRAVLEFVEHEAEGTGMGFRREGGGWTYVRRILMLLGTVAAG